jgi:hypothetical protein
MLTQSEYRVSPLQFGLRQQRTLLKMNGGQACKPDEISALSNRSLAWPRYFSENQKPIRLLLPLRL